MMIIAVLLLLPFAAGAQEAKRAITKIAGDLYRFQNNFHYSVFLVTPDGVIATDPINAEAAAWLKQEITARFGKQIKYVIYSHDHADHISGGEVWADGAVVIAHENAKAAIIGEKRPTAVPDLTFHRQMTVELGGKQVHFVGAIDALRRPAQPEAPPSWEIYINGGRKATGIDALEWVEELVDRGAGELVLNSIDADGTRDGYDIELNRAVADRVEVPIVASGGCGNTDHIYQVLTAGQASAALAASIFHFGDYTIPEVKKYLKERSVVVRD